MPSPINPGERVVVLAYAARTAAIMSGMAAGLVSTWIVRHKPALLLFGLVGGAIIGWVVGMLIGGLLFPSSAGNMTVARVGPSSLPLTLKGNLVASLISGSAACIPIAILTKTDLRALVLPAIGVSILIGIVSALLASLA